MKVTLVMFKDEERRDFPLTAESTVIGRRQECGLRIPTRDVSRRHCEVAVEENSVVARDLGSSNGTYVNGKRIAETKLNGGDRLRVGPVVFVVQINGKPASITPHDVKDELSKAGAKDAVPDDLFDLDDSDFDLDDPITSLGGIDDDDDEPPAKKK